MVSYQSEYCKKSFHTRKLESKKGRKAATKKVLKFQESMPFCRTWMKKLCVYEATDNFCCKEIAGKCCLWPRSLNGEIFAEGFRGFPYCPLSLSGNVA